MNTGEEMGWSQLPDLIIQPKDDKGKDYFVESRKSTLTVKGVLGLVFLGVSLAIFFTTLSTDYWFVGIALMAIVIVSFWWPVITNRKTKP
jgi:hypothetical protein